MSLNVRARLKRWRENYLLSNLLSHLAWPVWYLSHKLSAQLQTKVVKNGVTVRLPNGKKLTIGRDAGVAFASLLFWRGLEGYEPETSAVLRFFFSRSSTFIDVGANCGLYSLVAALWNPEIRVVAFEPVASTYESLRRNVALNKLEDRITCENMALSSTSGVSILHLPDSEGRDAAATGTLARDSWQVRRGAAAIPIRTIRFDEYESSHPMRVDLIKVDVEDFEAEVLDGMRNILQRDRPFVVCEILPRKEHWNERTRKLLQEFKYTPYWITRHGYVRVSRFDFDRTEYKDFLLSPVLTEAEIVTDLEVLFKAREGYVELPHSSQHRA